MNEVERRRHPRHHIKIGATISVNNQEISGTIINISEGGIGIVAEKSFFPGTELSITLKYIDYYCIHGIVRWSQLYHEDSKTYHQIGIEVQSILIGPEDSMVETPERLEFVQMILSGSTE